jgi:hypothetical protein
MLMGAARARRYKRFFGRPGSSQTRRKQRRCRCHFMPHSAHNFAEGDRVQAKSRPEFPDGTVLRLMELGYLLVRWDSDVLETAHYSELTKLGSMGGSL